MTSCQTTNQNDKRNGNISKKNTISFYFLCTVYTNYKKNINSR